MRKRTRAVARIATVASLALTVTVGLAWPASAHPSDGTQTDAEHAAQDLAGTPITTIERETRANAAKIAAVTGTVPGRRSAATTSSSVERRAVAAAVDPGVGGSWSSVVATPVVPVFQAVLPNGKVLSWDSVGDGAAESYPDQTFTRAMVWDPTTNTSKRVDVVGYNIFCSGYTQLPNGNVFVAGGNKDQALAGIVQTHIFDWRTETWSRGPDMASGRWYPSVAPLANGEAYISGGGPTTAEVYQTDNTLRSLLGFTDPSERWYPFLITRPDGQVQWAGPKNAMRTINPAGNGAVTASQNRDGKQRDYGSFATYAIGKTLIAGGGNFTEDGQTTVPTKTAVIVDTNSGTTVTNTGSMAQGRRQYDLTVLADGSVLATGGMSKVRDNDLVNLTDPTFAAERWNPATSTWTTLAPASRVRQYHSTAALLPDGRVMTGGGGVCGACTTKGYLEKNVEYFTPPYLYKSDGSGTLATRPVISSAPTDVSLNSTFAIGTAQAASVKKVGLIRLGAPTHGDDQGQRYVPLGYTVSGTTLTATAPANGAIAPPGYYYLVVTDSAGVPSVAKIVKVAQGSNPVATSIKGVGSNKCVDIDGARAVNKARIQLYSCNSSAAQMWTPQADGTLQALGKCMDVDGGRRVVGGPVQIYTCNGTTAQKWTRGADQTIRPTASPTLCLGAVSGGTANKTLLELQTCNAASTAQKWTW